MRYMNDHEISRAIDVLNREAPELAPFAQYLSDWRDVINANSDGWAYWKVGPKAASGLMAQIDRAVMSVIQLKDDLPTVAELKKTLAPIKAACTRHNLTAPTLQDAPTPGMKL